MIERVLLVFWGLWLLLIALAALRVFLFPIARRIQDRRWRGTAGSQKPVAVVVAVRGFDRKNTPGFFDALFAQAYDSYRVIVSFESWEDPTAKWLQDELELDPSSPFWRHPDAKAALRSITLVCAGEASSEGQKVHNQRAALECLKPDDAIVAFADGDISLDETWLSRLAAPVNQGKYPLSTTYRWLVPKRPTLPNHLACVINGSIATQGGWVSTNVLWGGSMAVARETFDSLEVPSLLEGSLNDDLRISKAARKAGNRIAFVRSLILPTHVDFTWGGFFEFAKRQYTQVKFFSPILYAGVNFLLTFYVAGLASIVAALVYGYFYAWAPLAAAYVIDQFRSLARQQVYLSLFKDPAIRRKLFSASWLEHMLTPVWMLLHWLVVVSTWPQSRITWAGITYRILSPSKTRVLARDGIATALPVGVPGLALISGLHDLSPRAEAAAALVGTIPEEAPETRDLAAAEAEALPQPEPETAVPAAIAAPAEIAVPTELAAEARAHPGLSRWVTPLHARPRLPKRILRAGDAGAPATAGSAPSRKRRHLPAPEAKDRTLPKWLRSIDPKPPCPLPKRRALAFPLSRESAVAKRAQSAEPTPAAGSVRPQRPQRPQKHYDPSRASIPLGLAKLPPRFRQAVATARNDNRWPRPPLALAKASPLRPRHTCPPAPARFGERKGIFFASSLPIPSRRFPTNPELAASAPARGSLAVAGPALRRNAPADPMPVGSEIQLCELPTASHAAHRVVSSRAIRRVGPLLRRCVRSARTSHVSRNLRGTRVHRPSAPGPSGRKG